MHYSKNQDEAIELPLFSFSRIATATSNFSPNNILGRGGFGLVYKVTNNYYGVYDNNILYLYTKKTNHQGVLEEGLEIAVKRLSKSSSQGVDEFKNEVICISKLQHRNLVKLLGCCIKGDEKLLIYEYMPNGSLDSFIFGKNHNISITFCKYWYEVN